MCKCVHRCVWGVGGCEIERERERQLKTRFFKRERERRREKKIFPKLMTHKYVKTEDTFKNDYAQALKIRLRQTRDILDFTLHNNSYLLTILLQFI